MKWWGRTARGLVFLSPLAALIALLSIKTDGNFLVLFLSFYGLPYLSLKPYMNFDAFAALFTAGIALQTLALAWWVGGASTRVRAALRAAAAATLIGLAFTAYILLALISAVLAGL